MGIKKKASKAAEWSIKIRTKIYYLKASIGYWWKRSQTKVCWGCVNSWYRLLFQETSMRREEISNEKGRGKMGQGKPETKMPSAQLPRASLAQIPKGRMAKSLLMSPWGTLFSFEVLASILQKAGTWLCFNLVNSHLENELHRTKTSFCAFSLQVLATTPIDSCLLLFSLVNYYWLQERNCATFYNNCELSLW